MSTHSHTPHRDSRFAEGRTSLDQDWTQLRTLLLAPEQTQLDELRDRLDHQTVQARDVGSVLPEAFAMRGEHDQQLSSVLTPYVENGFITAVRKSPGAIVDAIAPIMGPAIRHAIVHTLQSMMQSLNRSLDESLSPRGFRWRVEAWRTGRPFAEVVLLHTLRYRVEQVFLIHRETGLLLHHIATDAAVVQDEHVLSGMLTAIQSYVRDSFGASQDQTLDQFQVGEWTVWIEQGSLAYVAGVIRGTPPASLREDFRDAVDDIHARHADVLERFDGNTAPFKTAQTRLESCLQAHYESPASQGNFKIWILGSVVLLVSLWLGWMAYQAHARWADLLAKLRAEPGIVVTKERSTWGDYHLEGLRDPLSKDPSDIIREAGIDLSTVTTVWSPFYALEPQLIATRAQSMLQPPGTVRLQVDGDSLVATGSAPIEWAKETKRLAVLIPGITHYRDEGLITVSIPDLLTRLNRTIIHFSPGSAGLEPAEVPRLDAAAVILRDLNHAASQSGRRVKLEILGSVDETGSTAINLQLSRQRAEAVLAVLGREHLGAVRTVTKGIEQPEDKLGLPTDHAGQRSVTLRASIEALDHEPAIVRP